MTQKANMPAEKSITRSILKWLNDQPGCYAVKTHGGPFQAGQPDILGCFRGQMFALEVKRPGNKPTKLQVAMLRKWLEAGAIIGVVTSLDEVKEMFAWMLVREQDQSRDEIVEM